MTVTRSDKITLQLSKAEVHEFINDNSSIAWPEDLWPSIKAMLVKRTFMNINEEIEGSSYFSNNDGATAHLTIFRKENI